MMVPPIVGAYLHLRKIGSTSLSSCPKLHAEVVTAPVAQAAWNDLLEQLYARYSDRVKGREVGVT